ncbi:tRNA glutamyl-Q(34) synthetase GluQRS [uncultured Olegusella sp.]|uniref:tRNA glutamyl-Q(34) synthetase GluQRS n=1 Tax=uncultured Olegusella sp. TaxID=1979846 RepID=UPI00345DD130
MAYFSSPQNLTFASTTGNAHAFDATAPMPPKLVGRFAPTPSGRMHLGNVFSALLGWLAVRSAGGKMVLRIEDLDPRAQQSKLARLIMDDLQWLGLDWDEGPAYQSERKQLYENALELLKSRKLVYPCFCSRAELHAAKAPHTSDGTYIYQGTCRNLSPAEIAEKSRRKSPAYRLRVPELGNQKEQVDFDDLIWGHQEECLAQECGDFLVRRSDGVFAYQLAVVVDDGAAEVNLVVRGRDLLGSVARQTYLAKLLELPVPRYAHVPLLIAPDGRRLSKREKDLDVGFLRAKGVSPARLMGGLTALVGLVPPGTEALPVDLCQYFDWTTLRKHCRDIVINDEVLQSLGIYR